MLTFPDQVEFQAKGRRGLAPPTLHGPGNLRPNVMDTMMAVLCMFTDDVLKAMCRGDIKGRRHVDAASSYIQADV